jgi:16S rRNA (guanine966-N2)-methyltransferase
MRIIAGEWRGRPLAAPAGQSTRPTSDRAREGLFSMLQSRLGSLEGLQVADLFAGTGALGLEALSRGAAHCTFVENDRAALVALKANIDRMGAAARADIRIQGAEHAPPPSHPCDIILIDPPYRSAVAETVLHRVANAAWLAPGAFVSIETDGAALALPSGVVLEAERRFGKAFIKLLRMEGV